MLHPASEKIADVMLPALRSVIARELSDRGFSQGEVAEMMGLTQPAVSQYLSTRRGKRSQVIREDPGLRERAERMATLVVQGRSEKLGREYVGFCRELVKRDDFEELVGYDGEFFVDF